jgi:SpoVK/Ycf46/Vps4 family AAA+-type ATPase
VEQLFDQIRTLLQARYPILLLVTYEEDRMERALVEIARTEERDLYQWTRTRGLLSFDGKDVSDTYSPAHALKAIESIAEPAIFAFSDLHPDLGDPEVVRRLRDLVRIMGPKKQSLCILSDRIRVPRELVKDVAILDVPLPSVGDVDALLSTLEKSHRLKIPADRREAFVRGTLGLTEREIKRLYARILIGGGRFGEDDLRALSDEKRRAIRKSRFLEFWDTAGSMNSVGGMDNLKLWLEERRLGFSDKARSFGLPEPKGVFMLGVQGCGKSLMAKAVADLWRLPLLRLDVAAVFSASGNEENSLRETVRVAESLSPVVLWIDEIEKGFDGRNGGGGEAFGYFLTWMQEKSKPVFVVATANEVRLLPPELLRKGRFDEIFFVDLPNVHERLVILEIHLRSRSRDPHDFDLPQVAEETDGFSGAELEQVVVSALYSAFAQDRAMDSDDLLDAARETVPLAITMDDRLKDLREWARPRARKATMDRKRVDFFSEWEETA